MIEEHNNKISNLGSLICFGEPLDFGETMKKKRSTRPKSIWLAIVGMVAIGIVVFVISRQTPESHCVSSETGDYQCFDNQAAAINYATGGRVNLPPDASSEEINIALRALESQS